MNFNYIACAALLLSAQQTMQSAVIEVKKDLIGNIICSSNDVEVIECKANGNSTYFIVTPEKVIKIDQQKAKSGIIKRVFCGSINALVVHLILDLFFSRHFDDAKDMISIATGVYSAITMD
ncbi:MAG: hypothetical protein BWY54_00439 [Candidatus Dependentiae bacterium ADurb.Bin331]|nr:MAG: hypothetical protein BWY54_00439 [Candidatus Dependentiae bacterium ADurb.Bin331]